MSGYFKQLQGGSNQAARELREKLAREQMGDAAYEKQLSYANDRAFKIFGIIFIVAFAGLLFGVVWLTS